MAVPSQPWSDWAYYWQAAGEVSGYERGGVGLQLVGLAKGLGWPPHLAMLLLNTLAAALLLFLVHHADPTRARA